MPQITKRAGVYSVTNRVNGKFYIGSSVDVDRRWASHRHSFRRPPICNSRLRSAVEKYGIENFTFALIEECEPTKEIILSREQHYINTLKPEYNILPTAGSNLGFKQPPSFFEKRCGQEPWNKGIPADPASIQRMIDARKGMEPWNKGTTGMMPDPWNKGVPQTEEARRKNSESHLGQEAWNKGQKMDEEYCRRASEAAKARHEADPDHQARMTDTARQANTGKSRPQDIRDRISASNLVSEARKAYADSVRGIPRTEDVKQKVSEALKTSEKAKAFRESRKGKPSKPSKSGHFGIGWRNDVQKWMVRIDNKKYGAFATLEEAIGRRDGVIAARSLAE